MPGLIMLAEHTHQLPLPGTFSNHSLPVALVGYEVSACDGYSLDDVNCRPCVPTAYGVTLSLSSLSSAEASNSRRAMPLASALPRRPLSHASGESFPLTAAALKSNAWSGIDTTLGIALSAWR